MDDLGLVEVRQTKPLMCLTARSIMEVDELVVCDLLWSRYRHLNHIYEDGGSSHWPISVQLGINSHFNAKPTS